LVQHPCKRQGNAFSSFLPCESNRFFQKPAFNDLLPKQFSQFADSLHPTVLENIARLKYKHPTVVQARAIPAFSCGQHLFIASETGSGKTLAFAAPILTDLIEQKALGHIDSKGFSFPLLFTLQSFYLYSYIFGAGT
jgi:superfamily II DNA/RNA helicase